MESELHGTGRSIAGIVLAAGEGTRFGGPKALAYLGDESFASLCVKKLINAGVNPIIVVAGASAEKVEASIGHCNAGGKGVSVIRNPDWAHGVITSIKKGLAAVPVDCIGAMVLPVHFPLLHEKTIEVLSELFAQEIECGGKIMLPFVDGKPGMPVIVGRDLFNEFAVLYGDDPLLKLVNSMPSRAVGISVDDQGTTFGVITRSDLLQALKLMFEEEYNEAS